MKKIFSLFLFGVLLLNLFACRTTFGTALADSKDKYYTVYTDEAKTNVLFLKGDDVSEGDMYLSHDNKLYKIGSVDEENKTAIATFLKDEQLPKYNISPKSNEDTEDACILGDTSVANAAGSIETTRAASTKKVGVYHTHNDESYYNPDGTDSVYGEGGIHDVGKALCDNFNKLGIETVYREDLHLPHNSGAYTRSQVTASEILNQGVDAIFDVHRDSTSRQYYLTKVNGEEMSAVRMVVGAASANYEENKNFAYSIKAYADEAYPGLIKDIYIGKGNYNQQLSTRAMLFEFGCENIEKEYAIKASEYVAKTMDVVLYGSDGASELSLNDISLVDADGNASVITGIVNDGTNGSVNSNTTLWICLGVLGAVVLTITLVLIFSKKARYKVGRFFSELFAGIFGKKKTQ